MRMALDRHKGATARLDVTDLDLAAFLHDPLPAEALRCLAYMHAIESHTVCYLRDLLVTSAHKDPAITSFLTFWSFEEHWHGDALAQVLAAHGAPAELGVAELRRRLGWRDRIRPLAHLLGSSVAGESFLAIHMSWGAINEWTTQAGYARLSARAGHPVLTELLRRIMRQEGRHIDFYASEARRRLEGDRRARRLTRLALRRLWGPVGSTVMPDREVSFLVGYLFGDAEGRGVAARIDRRVDGLPGLEGLGLIQRSIDRATLTGTG